MANKYLDLEGLKYYDIKIKSVIDKEKLNLQSQIDENKSYLEEETNRAQITEQSLTNQITKEQDRATDAEAALGKRIDDEISNRTSADTNIKDTLTTLVNVETDRAKGMENAIQTKFNQDLNNLEKSLTDDFTIKLNGRVDELNSSISSVRADSAQLVTDESATRISEDTKLQSNIDELKYNLDSEVASRQVADKGLQEQINNHLSDYRTTYTELSNSISEVRSSLSDSSTSTNTKIDNHINDKSNPHNVTKDQLGLDKVENTADKDKPISDAVQAELDKINIATNNLDTNLSLLDSKVTNETLKNTGDQTLTGDLIIAKDASKSGGNLVVQGNLEVKGSTKTVNQETITVDDNFLILNNKGISGVKSGLALKKDTNNNAYGIAYDPTTNSVNLGDGKISSEGEFTFTTGSNNPILTRDQNTNFTQDHLISWDSTNNRAVDSGYGKSDIKALKDTTSTNTQDISTLKTRLTTDETNIINIKSTHESDINSIKAVNESQEKHLSELDASVATKVDKKPLKADGTSALTTDSKEVVEAINELDKDLNSQISNYNAHITAFNNHLNDYNALSGKISGLEPLISVKNTAFNRPFYDELPLMDGVASPGRGVDSASPDETQVDNTVARGTHTHPTDTSRAPVKHSSTLTTYGVGSTTEYGHVKVDDSINTSSANPVQNKVITAYVDNETTRATNKESNLQSQINSEIDRAKGTESTLQTNINTETTRATKAEADLDKRIDDLDSETTLSASETVAKASQVDGKTTVTKQSIQIAMSQVTSLSNEFSKVRSEFASADKGLHDEFTAQDTALKADIDSNQERISTLETTIETVKDLNSSIKSIQESLDSTNYSKLYVLGFEPKYNEAGNVTGYSPVFTNLDDGELA